MMTTVALQCTKMMLRNTHQATFATRRLEIRADRIMVEGTNKVHGLVFVHQSGGLGHYGAYDIMLEGLEILW